MRCTYCNQKLPDNSSFCLYCGHQVGGNQFPPMAQIVDDREQHPQTNTNPQVIIVQQAPPNYNSYGTPPPLAPGHSLIPPKTKSPALACILSCLVAGLGQFYNGQVIKGIVVLLVQILVGIPTFIGAVLICVLSMIDAYQIAQKLNSGRPIGQFEWF